MHNGGEYVNWGQDISGLTPGREYVFIAYISNAIEPVGDSPDDPTIRLRIGGTSGMPDGTVIGGPTVLTEAATSNTTANSGWQRVAFSFTATSASEKLKITDSSTGSWGDDFAMTSIGIAECAPVPDYTVGISHTGTPREGDVYAQHITVSNAVGAGSSDEPGVVTITLPTGYSVNAGGAGAVTLRNNPDGYTCSADAASPQVITCQGSSGLAAGASQSFVFDVTIAATAAATATIDAQVQTLFEDNVANNNASDTIALVPDLRNQITIDSQTESTVVFRQAIDNIGTYHTSGGEVVTITLPAGLSVNNGQTGSVVPTGPQASQWNCVSTNTVPQEISCVHTGSIAPGATGSQVFLCRSES